MCGQFESSQCERQIHTGASFQAGRVQLKDVGYEVLDETALARQIGQGNVILGRHQFNVTSVLRMSGFNLRFGVVNIFWTLVLNRLVTIRTKFTEQRRE